MVLGLFFALLLFGCAHERDNPYDPHGDSYNPGLYPSSGSPLSSSSLFSVLVHCRHAAGCAEISAEACFASGGQMVASCSESSSSHLLDGVSSSGGVSEGSSSSLPPVMVLCRLSDGTCPLTLISQEACDMFGGTPVQSCVGSSSSVPSSSSYGSVVYGGQTYRTVRIGEQVWFAENLNYAVEGSKCYSNNSANCDKYGSLYNWVTAMNLPASCNSSTCSGQIQSKHQGICPAGWHLPSDAEWTTLTNYVGSSPAGTKLKAASGWSSGNNTDEYGFSALPGGYGTSDGSFYNVGGYGNWWSANQYNSHFAYYRSMNYDSDVAYWYYDFKSNLFSVRCVQD